MDMIKVLTEAIEKDATDVYIIAGLPLTMKINGKHVRGEEGMLMPDDCKTLISQIYDIASRNEGRGPMVDDDFSFAINQGGRFRVNVFMQRGSFAAVVRVIQFGLPVAAEIGVTEDILDFANMKNGLVLVTGAAGSGKSTTLACIIDKINREKEKHIITLEDPIEFIYRHDKSIVTQREIDNDVESFQVAMRSVLRESTDVVLLGEMRDKETMEVAISAAEIGQLILSTLHTMGAANTVDRIIDSFPPNQQQQIRTQLALTLKGVISQQLVPDVNGNLIPVFEIMKTNIAISNMIRDGRIHQINSALLSDPDMSTMDESLLKLVESGKITVDTAYEYGTNPNWIQRKSESK